MLVDDPRPPEGAPHPAAILATNLALALLVMAVDPIGAWTATATTAPAPVAGPVAPQAGPAGPVAPLQAGTAAVVAAAVPPAADTPVTFTTAGPDARVRIAIDFALRQIGVPYVWGGDGPASGEGGFDCSGLTTAAYAAAGIRLPRTAQTQFDHGPHVPSTAPLLPGDLVFYGTPARVHHVGLYLGDGRMVNAPRRGKPVQVAAVRYPGDDYLGATRPAAVPGALQLGTLGQVTVPPSAPAPAVPPVEFPAPQVAPPATVTLTVATPAPAGGPPAVVQEVVVVPPTALAVTPTTAPVPTGAPPSTTTTTPTTTPGTAVPGTTTPGTTTPGSTTPGTTAPSGTTSSTTSSAATPGSTTPGTTTGPPAAPASSGTAPPTAATTAADAVTPDPVTSDPAPAATTTAATEDTSTPAPDPSPTTTTETP